MDTSSKFLLFIIIVLLFVAGYFFVFKNPQFKPYIDRYPILQKIESIFGNDNIATITPNTVVINFDGTSTTTASTTAVQTYATPILSKDRKSILANDVVLLNIDDDAIFDFFKKQSQLCDKANIGSNATRKRFCEDRAVFKSMTTFTKIVRSHNNTKIGFTIESSALTPDTVAGLFYVDRAIQHISTPTASSTATSGVAGKDLKSIAILTNYYLGNEFISFSPASKYFVYRSNCFEDKCGLFIVETETLKKVYSFNSGPGDNNTQVFKFIKWQTNNSFEYEVDGDVKSAEF